MALFFTFLKLVECSKLSLSISQITIDASVTMKYLISRIYLVPGIFKAFSG